MATQRATLHERRPAAGDAEAEQRLYRDLAFPFLSFSLASPAGMEARTCFIDEKLVDAVEKGVSQVVIVGAGYDGRPLRFSETPARWIEVDHPATQQDKIRRLKKVGAPSGHITFAAVDLLGDDLDAALDKAGHDLGEPTFWLCEGLFPYLPPPAVEGLCATLRRRSNPQSTLVCNVLVRDRTPVAAWLVRPLVDGLLAAIGERRLCEFSAGDIESFLAATGWQVNETQSANPGRADGSYMLAVTASPKPG